MESEFVDEVGPLEETGKCENCEEMFPDSKLRYTDDDVLLCPACWEACIEEAEATQ